MVVDEPYTLPYSPTYDTTGHEGGRVAIHRDDRSSSAETGQLNLQFSSLGRVAFYRYLSATSADSSTEDARG